MKDEELKDDKNRRGVSDLNCLLAPRWISVEDKLPEKGQVVDIWARYSEHRQWQVEAAIKANVEGWKYDERKLKGWRVVDVEYDTFFDGNIECDRFKLNGNKDFITQNREVTHWMPKPDAPEK